MKQIIIIQLLWVSIGIFAQKQKVKNNPEYDDRPIHFGYTLGINVMDFGFGRYYMRNPNIDTLYADLTDIAPGFQVGMIADFRLGEYLNFRVLPSFNFGQRNLSFFVDKGREDMILNRTFKTESSMLDLPIQLKYKAKRINNYRPYVLLGSSVRYDLASKKKYKIENNELDEYILLKPLDFYVEMGSGIDFYLPYFKFSTEIKFSVGLLDILNHTLPEIHAEYVKSLRKLNSHIIMISFHFE